LSELIESNDLKDLVLVGHSMGASIVAKIAEKFPSRINRVIFIAGTLIDGECIFDVIPKSRKSTYLNDSKKSKDNSVPVNSALVRSHFLNGCDEDIISFALKNLTPQAIGTYATKIKLNTFKQLETPSTYIICDNDLVVPKEMTQKYISRLTKKSEVLHLNSNHEPMLEKPKELAKMIKEITQRKFEV
jgi:pimeloyl-ACP methyl ester carboxylesterase